MIGEERKMVGPLEGLRALDLTDHKGLMCGKLLADLGVDVLKVEKPGGDAARWLGPFYHNLPSPDGSLSWLAFNAGKKSITLNLETADGKDIFRKLVARADFVIESFSPGYLDLLGLDYSALSAINARLIVVSITPFGQDGPYCDYEVCDLIVMALGGYLYVNGDSDRPPVTFGVPQAFLLAAAEGVAGGTVALYHREKTGMGQHVDVSAQECVARLLTDAHQLWEIAGFKVTRQGPRRVRQTGAKLQMCWPCRDGHVGFQLMGGAPGVQTMRALHEWMESEGMGDPYIRNTDWAAFDWTLATPDEVEKAEKPIRKFFSQHTKGELYAEAIKRRIFLFPVSTSEDIRDNEQLMARGFWQPVEHPKLNTLITYPGSFVRSTEAFVGIQKCSPLIGEHNDEIYKQELGLSTEEIVALAESGVI